MTREDLIEALEAATEPSRELDLEILRLQSGNDWQWFNREMEWITYDKYGKAAVGNPVCSLSFYTCSIDTASTLVPPGFHWSLHCDADGTAMAGVERDQGDSEGCTTSDSTAATPAIALCMAALIATAAALPGPPA